MKKLDLAIFCHIDSLYNYLPELFRKSYLAYFIILLYLVRKILGKWFLRLKITGQMIEESKINQIVERIVNFYDPDKIILFGSYAYGIPDKDSDLDFLIVKDTPKPRPEKGY
jgi:hypothetical protein